MFSYDTVTRSCDMSRFHSPNFVYRRSRHSRSQRFFPLSLSTSVTRGELGVLQEPLMIAGEASFLVWVLFLMPSQQIHSTK